MKELFEDEQYFVKDGWIYAPLKADLQTFTEIVNSSKKELEDIITSKENPFIKTIHLNSFFNKAQILSKKEYERELTKKESALENELADKYQSNHLLEEILFKVFPAVIRVKEGIKERPASKSEVITTLLEKYNLTTKHLEQKKEREDSPTYASRNFKRGDLVEVKAKTTIGRSSTAKIVNYFEKENKEEDWAIVKHLDGIEEGYKVKDLELIPENKEKKQNYNQIKLGKKLDIIEKERAKNKEEINLAKNKIKQLYNLGSVDKKKLLENIEKNLLTIEVLEAYTNIIDKKEESVKRGAQFTSGEELISSYIQEKGSCEYENLSLNIIGKTIQIKQKIDAYVLEGFDRNLYQFPSCHVAVKVSNKSVSNPYIIEAYKHPFLRGSSPFGAICLGNAKRNNSFSPENVSKMLNLAVKILTTGYYGKSSINPHNHLEGRYTKISKDDRRITSGKLKITNESLV